jgi:hypothetical protein
MGVPYDPAIAKGLSPNPTGGGDPKNTACVTLIPILKPKSIPYSIISISKLQKYFEKAKNLENKYAQ